MPKNTSGSYQAVQILRSQNDDLRLPIQGSREIAKKLPGRYLSTAKHRERCISASVTCQLTRSLLCAGGA